MRARYKRWTLLAALAAILLFAFLTLSHGPRATTGAVAITFVGYTNPRTVICDSCSFQSPTDLPSPSDGMAVGLRLKAIRVPRQKPKSQSSRIHSPADIESWSGVEPGLLVKPLYDSETARWRFAMSFTLVHLAGAMVRVFSTP
jgi:hypothetical protein